MTWQVEETHPGNKLLEVYHRLEARYGQQYWWPAEEPFEVMVGAILTQRVSWTNAERAITKLKAAGALSPQVLRRLPVDELARLIRASLFHNAKARKLKAMVSWLGEHYQDNLSRLFSQDGDNLRRELVSVYGIGEETADSIILYAAAKPVFVIDAYTRRILSRVGIELAENTYRAYQILFMAHLPADTGLYNQYHALLVRLGKTVCRPRPLCGECCLVDYCHYGSDLETVPRLS